VSTKDEVPTHTGYSILSRIKWRGTQEVHEFSIAKQPLVIEGPFTTLRDAPRLGIDVDWDLVNEHRIS
jgi:L-alanine-DL-glutamate epimerase-like enolase superfamily enzyme